MSSPAPILTIRAADEADATAVHEVLLTAFTPLRARYTPEAFAATVLSAAGIRARLAEGPVWLALLDGRPAGTAALLPTPHGAYLRGMAVVPVARGRGLGRALLERAEAYALAGPFERIYLNTTPFLLPAIRLYESHGFLHTDDGPPDLFGTPLISMARVLSREE